jgi:hypothetical protein
MWRLLRRAFNFAAAVSALLLAATCVLWARSYRVHDVFRWQRKQIATGEAESYWRVSGHDTHLARGRLTVILFTDSYEPIDGSVIPTGNVSIEFRDGTHASTATLPDLTIKPNLWLPSPDPHLTWHSDRDFGTPVYWQGINVNHLVARAGDDTTLIAMSFVWLALFFLLPPALWAVTAVGRARSRWHPGICPTCGYDLRATPARCPECGAVPKTTGAT